jgi:ubiquitin-like domain-containing CTD phosphatase 1
MYKSDFAFRLLMDGKVLTSKMKGCPAEADLCDVQVLLDRVIPFATTNRNCTATKPESRLTTTINLSVGGAVLLLSVILMSGLLGSLATFFVMTRRLPVCKNWRENNPSLSLSDHTLLISGEKDAEEAVQLTLN